MAANGEIIKSFLVGLGFDVDESSLAVFNKAIATAALRVTALYTAVNAFAASMVFAFAKISEGFEEMGYQYHIIAPAINKAIVLRQELLKAYGAAGINIRKVIVDSVKLNMSLTKTKYAMEAIYKSVGSRFFGLLQKQSDAFRKKLYDNMPLIINSLEKLVKTVFKAFEAVTILGGRLWSILSRVYDFFVTLDQATNGWSTVILGVVAAWKLLNLEFIATPLGALLTGMVALLALFDDFKTWQEGGKSLFDWTAALPLINAVTTELQALKGILDGIFTIIFNIGGAVVDVFQGKWLGAIDRISDAFGGVKQAAGSLWDATGIGKSNFKMEGPALGSTPSPHNTNMNANMQTQININGSPNADATARATAGQQQNVNRDFVRNMKGATGNEFLSQPLQDILLKPTRKLGTIAVQVVVNEAATDTLTITRQPVQQGASITDHAYMEPTSFSHTIYFTSGGTTLGFSAGKSLDQIYQELLDLQSSAIPFDIVTPKRIYHNMLMNTLGQTTDKLTENCLAIHATYQQIIIVPIRNNGPALEPEESRVKRRDSKWRV